MPLHNRGNSPAVLTHGTNRGLLADRYDRTEPSTKAKKVKKAGDYEPETFPLSSRVASRQSRTLH